MVSILIPCWGCREYITGAIESALAQTYPEIEVIVVEDCGSDGTYEAALNITGPRLRVIRNEKNLGQYGNKNRALKHAKGALIKYLDGDDLLEPHAVATLMAAYQSAGLGAGIVFGRFITIDQNGTYVSTPRNWGVTGRCRGTKVLDLVTRKRLAGSMFGNVSPHLFHRRALEAVGGFPQGNAGPGDMETFLKLLCVTDVCFTEAVVARYRCHPGGMSSRTFGLKECADYLVMVDRLSDYFRTINGVALHLREGAFLQGWKVWASTHIIMATFHRRLRGYPNQFHEIRRFFIEQGLKRQFDRFLMIEFPRFVAYTLGSKVRKALDKPQHPTLFSKSQAAVLGR